MTALHDEATMLGFDEAYEKKARHRRCLATSEVEIGEFSLTMLRIDAFARALFTCFRS
jgi:hypothetical protein